MEPKQSKYIVRVWKSHNQHALLKRIEKHCSILKKENKIKAILMDLSKLLDTINHSNLLFKLKARDFNKSALTFS